MNIPKFLIAILLTLTIWSGTEAGIKQIPIKIKNAIWWMLSNKYIQTYVADALFIYGEGVCNAKCDGYVFDKLYGDGKVYGIGNDWHIWKNMGRTCTWSAIFLKGIGLAQKHLRIGEFLTEMASVGIITNGVWHYTYPYTRYGSIKEYQGKADHYFWYPNPFNFSDAYISMNGKVHYANIGQITIGLAGLIYSEIN